MKRYKKILLTGWLTLFLSIPVFASETPEIEMTLEDALNYARDHSPNLEIVRQSFLNARWEYEAFLKDFFPQLSLTGNLPGLNRSIKKIG